MKTIKKLGAVLIAVLLLAAIIAPATAFAADYTPVAGTSTTFKKYLIMDAGDNVPNVTFSFSVAAGTPIAAVVPDPANNVAGKMEVLAGVVVTDATSGAITSPSIADVTFAPSDTTATEAGTNIDVARAASARVAGLTAETGVQLESGEKYATKEATVSFTGVNFPEPGIYRYIITETASATDEAAGIMHDNDVDRVLDVYVTDNGSGTLVVSSYVLHTDVNDIPFSTDMGSNPSQSTGSTAVADKTDGFTNEYNSKDLKVSKEVSGNQASRDKYFKLTVKTTNIADSDVFTVSLANDNNADTNDGSADSNPSGNSATLYSSMSNPTSVTGTQLKAGVDFYLQHGQSVVIRGLAPNAGYEVTENAEDYKSAAMSGKTNSGTIGTVAGSNKLAEAGFTNTRNGTVPTGVILTVVPGIVIVGLAVSGLVLIGRKKRNET